MADGPKYPNVTVQLTGRDGNAGAIMGATTSALRRAGVKPIELHEYRAAAMAGTYDELLTTTMAWVNVE